MVFIQEIINEFKSIGSHWIALYVNGDNMTYFDSFRVECIPKKIQGQQKFYIKYY